MSRVHVTRVWFLTAVGVAAAAALGGASKEQAPAGGPPAQQADQVRVMQEQIAQLQAQLNEVQEALQKLRRPGGVPVNIQVLNAQEAPVNVLNAGERFRVKVGLDPAKGPADDGIVTLKFFDTGDSPAYGGALKAIDQPIQFVESNLLDVYFPFMRANADLVSPITLRLRPYTSEGNNDRYADVTFNPPQMAHTRSITTVQFVNNGGSVINSIAAGASFRIKVTLSAPDAQTIHLRYAWGEDVLSGPPPYSLDIPSTANTATTGEIHVAGSARAGTIVVVASTNLASAGAVAGESRAAALTVTPTP